MLSTAQTLEKVLKELFIKLQDRQNRLFYTYQEDTCFVRLAVSYQKKPQCSCPQLLMGTAARCGESCWLFWSLTAGFLSAADLH